MTPNLPMSPVLREVDSIHSWDPLALEWDAPPRVTQSPPRVRSAFNPRPERALAVLRRLLDKTTAAADPSVSEEVVRLLLRVLGAAFGEDLGPAAGELQGTFRLNNGDCQESFRLSPV